MKLIAGLVALAAAAPTVINCNAGKGGTAAMSMTILETDVQQAPTDFTLNAGVYSHTVYATPGNTSMNTKTNALVLTHSVASGGCLKEEGLDGVKVCTKVGHSIIFTCSYPMDNQDIKTDTDFKVSGSDTEKTAAGTGKLTYKLAVDNTSFSIGSKVTATITPVTTGLVHATIESCKVTNKGTSAFVKLIDDGMTRECKLGVDVTTPQGTGVLGFNWSSFKWSTALSGKSSPDEDQDVSCNISLSKAKPTTEAQDPVSCNAGKVTWTKIAGTYCVTTYSIWEDFGTVDKCKTKCLSDKTCKFVIFDVYMDYCYLHTAKQCQNQKSDSQYDLYQAVESPAS